jgi:acyl dehydratase
MSLHTPPSTKALGPDFAAPIDDRYFEDYEPGASYEYGSVEVTEAEILEFANRWDPQPIHTAPEWAATGPFGGLIASGWHTAAICMRMFIDHYLTHNASLASPGVNDMAFPRPTRPGDVLKIRFTIVEARASRTKPDRGLIYTRFEAINQDDLLAMSLVALNMVSRRHPG